MPENIEKIFYDEVRTKKRAGSNIFKRASTRRGGSGTVYFTSDLLKGRAKREHRKAGKVIVSNMFDKIDTRQEFEALTEEEQVKRLKYWRENYKVKEIQRGMGVASATFYNYIDKLGLQKQRLARGPSKNKKSKAKQKKEVEQQPQEVAIKQEEPTKAPQVLVLNGLNIAYNGTYKAQEIQAMLSKLDVLLEADENEFTIELRLMQN